MIDPVYYNEFDPYAAQHLRNLIAAGHIAPGYVDERSIEDVTAEDLAGYTQCHFFAGVGVWSRALRLAGWPDNRPVWTASCPCQPFSAAGKGGGFDDERHLWPALYWLAQQCRPVSFLGEQVASRDAETWIDLVHADLEAMDYAFGCVPFPAAGVGAPNIRDRAYWVAHANGEGLQGRLLGRPDTQWQNQYGQSGRNSTASGLADTNGARRLEGDWELPPTGHGNTLKPASGYDRQGPAGPVNGFWRGADWLSCTDGKWRPVRPGTFPLVNGASGRVGRLRAYGNCLNVEAAKEFIKVTMEFLP